MQSRARAVTALIGASTLATSMASVAEAATTHSSAPSPQLAAATTTVCVTTSDVVRLAETWPQVERAVQRVRVAERHLARELRAEARAAAALRHLGSVTANERQRAVWNFNQAHANTRRSHAALVAAKAAAEVQRARARASIRVMVAHALCPTAPPEPQRLPSPTPTPTTTTTATPSVTTSPTDTGTTPPAPTPTVTVTVTATVTPTPTDTTSTTPAPTPTTTTTPAPTPTTSTTTPAPTPTTSTTPTPTDTTTTTPAPTPTTTTTTPAPTPTPTQAAPTGLTASSTTSLNNGTMKLSWTAAPGATSYLVTRSGTLIGTTTSTTLIPTGTTLNTFADYAVTAVGAATSVPTTALSVGVFQGTLVADKKGLSNYGNIQTTIVVTAATTKSTTGCWATYPTTSDSASINRSAIPRLCTQVLTNQPSSTTVSTLITTVSGASATSPAFKTSLQAALVLAGM